MNLCLNPNLTVLNLILPNLTNSTWLKLLYKYVYKSARLSNIRDYLVLYVLNWKLYFKSKSIKTKNTGWVKNWSPFSHLFGAFIYFFRKWRRTDLSFYLYQEKNEWFNLSENKNWFEILHILYIEGLLKSKNFKGRTKTTILNFLA